MEKYDDFVILGFFRYCLPRHSYAVQECIVWLDNHWDEMSNHLKTVIRSEIQQFLCSQPEHPFKKEWTEFFQNHFG